MRRMLIQHRLVLLPVSRIRWLVFLSELDLIKLGCATVFGA